MRNSMSGCSRRRLAVVALAATAMVLGVGNPATSQEPNSSQAVERESSKSSPPDRNHYSRPGIPEDRMGIPATVPQPPSGNLARPGTDDMAAPVPLPRTGDAPRPGVGVAPQRD